MSDFLDDFGSSPEEGYDHDNAGSNSDRLDSEGYFHIKITDIDPREGETNSNGEPAAIVVEYEVIGAKSENDLGCTGREYISKKRTDHSRDKRVRFFIATQLVTLNQVKSRNVPRFDIMDAIGKTLCVRTSRTKPNDEGNTYINWHFLEIWHPKDPKAKDYPKFAPEVQLCPDFDAEPVGAADSDPDDAPF